MKTSLVDGLVPAQPEGDVQGLREALERLKEASAALPDGEFWFDGARADVYVQPKGSCFAGDRTLLARCSTGDHWLKAARFFAEAGNYARAALTAAPARQRAVEGVDVDVQRMNTSRGTDFYVRIRCGGREVTPHMFHERYKAEYEADHFAWIFGLRADEPEILAYDETTYPNDAALSPERADVSPRREMGEAQGTVTESIFSGTSVIIPLADVQHIERHDKNVIPGIMVISKHTTWDKDHDLWANAIWMSEPEAGAFKQAWCRYRHELELHTLADLAAPPPNLAAAPGEARVTEEMVEAGNDAAYEAAALGGDHKAAMRAALEAALAVQPAPDTLDRATLEAAAQYAASWGRGTIVGKEIAAGLRALPSASTTAQSGYGETRTVAIEADGTKRLLPRDW